MRFQQGRQVRAEAADKRAEERQYQHPQKHRTFVVSPYAGDFVDQRHHRVRVFVNRRNRKIRCHIAGDQCEEGEPNKYELHNRGRGSKLHQGGIINARAHNRRTRLDQSKRKRQHQSIMPQFRNHFVVLPALLASPSCQRPLFFSASTTSRGIYRSSCLASTVSAASIPPGSSLPSTTTPCPSRKRSGTMPRSCTGMSVFPSVTEKRTSRLSPRSTLPGFTNPPILIRAPGTTRFSATSVGELKNTMESRNAPSTSAAAIASTPRLVPISDN